jgi:organic hydroperoxide reductase OsmC/OhrA
MAAYRATVDWTLTAPAEDFAKGRYSRGHSVSFGSGVEVPGTASHQVVGNKWAVEGAVDPEEMLVGSICACHMLSFLHVAREAVTRVTLRPEITYDGCQPTAAERDHLHHAAHEACFIANSVKTEIVVEEPT